jgi:hypothetical protein
MVLALRDPYEATFTAQDGTEKTLILSHFYAWEGTEIALSIPWSALSNLQNLQDFGGIPGIMGVIGKILKYVAVPIDGREPIRLTTPELVDNHIPDWEMVLKIVGHMITYNASFFQDGRVLTFFEDLAQKVPAWITKTFQDSLALFFQKVKPPLES